MDINTLRITVTLVSFAAFALIVAWVLSPKARPGFEEAARLPFEEDGFGKANPLAREEN
jgi:cytochrome c oxidase cbb3-type subunit 4